MTKDESLRVRLPGDLKERLQEAAERLRVTSSELLRQAVEMCVNGIQSGELQSVNGHLDFTLLAARKVTMSVFGPKIQSSKQLPTEPSEQASIDAVMGLGSKGRKLAGKERATVEIDPQRSARQGKRAPVKTNRK